MKKQVRAKEKAGEAAPYENKTTEEDMLDELAPCLLTLIEVYLPMQLFSFHISPYVVASLRRDWTW